MKVSIYRTQIFDEQKSHSQARFPWCYRKRLLQRNPATTCYKSAGAESPAFTDSFEKEWSTNLNPTIPALCSPLTGQRLHVQLRLLGVHVVLSQRVEVRKYEAHRARWGAQLPQCVRSRLLGLGSNQAFGKSSPTFPIASTRRAGGTIIPELIVLLPSLSYCSVLTCLQAGCAKGPKNFYWCLSE